MTTTTRPVKVTAADWMQSTPALLTGSSAWAARYADEVRRIITLAAMYAPRSQQVHLGPSELGVACPRQVVGKLAGLPNTNHVVDPWPSVVGTAVHAWLAEACEAENLRRGTRRFLTETRVTPIEGHAGTADLYDGVERAVVDWKCLGETTLGHVRSADGPPRKYVVQLLLYGHGYRRVGLPVDRVALCALPRTKSTLDAMYVWERPHTEADTELLKEVFEQTEQRTKVADLVRSGKVDISQIPYIADDSECIFCPFYRPQSAHDGGIGCPGTATKRP